ncbi:MAG: DUF4331 domain-containing protein [Actinomycetes bacterium]
MRTSALLGAGMLLVGAGIAGLAPGTANASSHREAPGILASPQYDNTDVYAFNSPDRPGWVTIIANWQPFEEPAGGPNSYPWATDAHYNINIDSNGDAKPDYTYRYTFRTARVPGKKDSFSGNGTFLNNNGQVTSLRDANLLFRQTYDLTRIDRTGKRTKTRTLLDNNFAAPSYVGDVSMPDYKSLRDKAISRIGNGTNGSSGNAGKSFVGQTEDPFFLDLRVFDLLYGDQGTCNKEIGHDTLAGYNVNTIALQVPASSLTRGKDPVIGVWSTTDRKNSKGTYVQVSRLGQPLVNEVVIPYKVKDTFNSIPPSRDAAALPFVEKPELAALLKNVCGVNAPTDNRDDLVTVFLTGIKGLNQPKKVTPSEQLRLNTRPVAGQTPSRLGVIGGDKNGFPNGRRLSDDVVDIALQVVGGELKGNPNDLGDGVNANDAQFGTTFPYVALPLSGSVEQSSPAAKSGVTLLTGGADDAPTGGSLPVGELGLTGLGALALVAGSAAARRARGHHHPVPVKA